MVWKSERPARREPARIPLGLCVLRHSNRGAIRDDLLITSRNFVRVEPHCDNSVRSSTRRSFHQACESLLPRLHQLFCQPLQFTANKGLQTRTKLGTDIACANSQSGDLPVDLVDLVAGQVVRRSYQHFVIVTFASPPTQAAQDPIGATERANSELAVGATSGKSTRLEKVRFVCRFRA
jgi:hypothetical protein